MVVHTMKRLDVGLLLASLVLDLATGLGSFAIEGSHSSGRFEIVETLHITQKERRTCGYRVKRSRLRVSTVSVPLCQMHSVCACTVQQVALRNALVHEKRR